MPPKPFVDLFAGCGGMSLGLQQAGWTPVCGVDSNKHAMATYAHNFKRARALCADLSSPKVARELVQAYGGGRLHAVVGGPPCQEYSLINMTRSIENKRIAMPALFARIATALEPKYIVVEEVPVFLSAHGGKYHRQVHAILKRRGYVHIKEGILMATDYGAATARKRFMLVASRAPIGVEWPPRATVRVPKTVRVAWRENTPARKCSADARPHPTPIPESTQQKVREREGKPFVPGTYFQGSYGVVELNKPATVLTTHSYIPGSGAYSVPVGNGRYRRLTVHEAKVLQSFPAHFHFMKPDGALDSLVEAYRQIGNSVCPAMARAVGKALN